MIKEGTYTAKIVEYGLPKPKEGKSPCCTVTFAFKEDGEPRRLTWYGYFTEKAMKRTMDTLQQRCGFKSDKPSGLLSPGALDFNKDLEIEVAHEEYLGEVSAKIKWINELGGAKFEQMAAAQALELDKLVWQSSQQKATGTSDFAPGTSFSIED